MIEFCRWGSSENKVKDQVWILMLSKNLVGKFSVDLDKAMKNKSAISKAYHYGQNKMESSNPKDCL